MRLRCPPLTRTERRVVVTGLGAVTPLGVGAHRSWKRLLEKKSGISLGEELMKGLPRLRAEVPEEEWISLGERIEKECGSGVKGARCIAFGVAAADEAIRDANLLDISSEVRDRTGVCVGTGIGSIEVLADAACLIDSGKHRRLSPYFVPRTLVNLTAGHISMRHKLRGPNHACSNACATGANSIGDAYRFIQRGDADIMIAGGTEACIHPVSVAGFARMRALCTNETIDPRKSSRPFDESRSGFVIGEGAAVLVLETLEHAFERNATIYAEIRGYGMSGDAHHVSAPSPDGSGALRCMQAALRDTNISVDDLGYINAHATSTPMGDEIEAHAIGRLVSCSSSEIYVSSTKGATGHLLGAAGSLEAMFTVLAIRDNEIPPTLNLDSVSKELEEGLGERVTLFGENHATLSNRPPLRAALSNSFGFGGTNASLLFASYSG